MIDAIISYKKDMQDLPMPMRDDKSNILQSTYNCACCILWFLSEYEAELAINKGSVALKIPNSKMIHELHRFMACSLPMEAFYNFLKGFLSEQYGAEFTLEQITSAMGYVIFSKKRYLNIKVNAEVVFD